MHRVDPSILMYYRAVAVEDEEAVAEVVEGGTIVVVGEKTIESASTRSQNTMSASRDTTIPC